MLNWRRILSGFTINWYKLMALCLWISISVSLSDVATLPTGPGNVPLNTMGTYAIGSGVVDRKSKRADSFSSMKLTAMLSPNTEKIIQFNLLFFSSSLLPLSLQGGTKNSPSFSSDPLPLYERLK